MLRPLAHLDFNAPDRRRDDPSADTMPQRVSRRALTLLHALFHLRSSPRRRRWAGSVLALCEQALLTEEEVAEAAYELALRGLVYHRQRGGGAYFSWRPGLTPGKTIIADPGQECVWTLAVNDEPRRRWDNTNRGVCTADLPSLGGPEPRDFWLNLYTLLTPGMLPPENVGYWLRLTLKPTLPRRTLVVQCGPQGVERLSLQMAVLPAHDTEADMVRLGRLWACELSVLGRLVSLPRCV